MVSPSTVAAPESGGKTSGGAVLQPGGRLDLLRDGRWACALYIAALPWMMLAHGAVNKFLGFIPEPWRALAYPETLAAISLNTPLFVAAARSRARERSWTLLVGLAAATAIWFTTCALVQGAPAGYWSRRIGMEWVVSPLLGLAFRRHLDARGWDLTRNFFAWSLLLATVYALGLYFLSFGIPEDFHALTNTIRTYRAQLTPRQGVYFGWFTFGGINDVASYFAVTLILYLGIVAQRGEPRLVRFALIPLALLLEFLCYSRGVILALVATTGLLAGALVVRRLPRTVAFRVALGLVALFVVGVFAPPGAVSYWTGQVVSNERSTAALRFRLWLGVLDAESVGKEFEQTLPAQAIERMRSAAVQVASIPQDRATPQPEIVVALRDRGEEAGSGADAGGGAAEVAARGGTAARTGAAGDTAKKGPARGGGTAEKKAAAKEKLEEKAKEEPEATPEPELPLPPSGLPYSSPFTAQLLPERSGAAGDTRTLHWTRVPDALAYYLYVGTVPGARDLIDTGETQATSWDASRLPLDRDLWVRVNTKFSDRWRQQDVKLRLARGRKAGTWKIASIEYTPIEGTVASIAAERAAREVAEEEEEEEEATPETRVRSAASEFMAEILLPRDGTPANARFRWSAVPAVEAYYLWVGTKREAKDVVDSGETLSTSWPMTELPLDTPLFLRLHTELAGVWRHQEATFRIVAAPDGGTPIVREMRVEPIDLAAFPPPPARFDAESAALRERVSERVGGRGRRLAFGYGTGNYGLIAGATPDMGVHNIVLEAFLGGGLLGLALFSAFWATALYRLWRWTVAAPGGEAFGVLGAGLMLTMVGILVSVRLENLGTLVLASLLWWLAAGPYAGPADPQGVPAATGSRMEAG